MSKRRRRTGRNRHPNSGTLEWIGSQWAVRYKDETGKRVRLKTGKADRLEAEAFLERWHAQRVLKDEIEDDTRRLLHTEAEIKYRLSCGKQKLAELRAVPVDEICRLLFEGEHILKRFREMSPEWREHWKIYIRHFARWTEERFKDGAVSTSAISREVAREYINSLKEKSLDAQRRTLQTMKSAFGELVDMGACLENPFAGIKFRESVKHTRKRMLTEDEMSRLQTVLKAKPPEIQLLFAFGIYTGQRFGDCRAMKWDYIKDDGRGGRYLKYTPSKTRRFGTKVTVPIAPQLDKMLVEAERTRTGEYITPGLAKRRAENLVRSVCRIFDEAGIERRDESGKLVVGFHSLRHTFVSRLANSGKPLSVIRSMVGHTSEDMTEYYTHTTLDAQRDAMDAFSSPPAGQAALSSQLANLIARQLANIPVESILRGLVAEKEGAAAR